MAPPVNLPELLTQRSYPGLPATEARICRRWLERHGAEYDAIDFNVRMGAGAPILDHYPPYLVALIRATSRLRADVVATRDDAVTIIEIEAHATLNAVGQLFGYRAAWWREHPNAWPVNLLLVTGRATEDVIATLASTGIGLEVMDAGHDE